MKIANRLIKSLEEKLISIKTDIHNLEIEDIKNKLDKAGIKADVKNTSITIDSNDKGKLYAALRDTGLVLKESNNEVGLDVSFRNRGDASKAMKLVDKEGFHAEFDQRMGTLFFEEEEDTIDELEKELDKIFAKGGLQGYSFEAVGI